MFIALVVPLSILLPILAAFLNFKHLKAGAKILFYWLIISGAINTCAIILVKLKMTNLPLLHLYTTVEAVMILAYLRTLFEDSRIRKLLGYVMVFFPILCILNIYFLQSLHTFNTHTRPLEAILITSFCLLYLYKSGFTDNFIEKPSSWFNAGILIYFPAASVIFILSNYMVFVKKNRIMNDHIWDLHATLVLLMYIIWARGFYLTKNGR